MSLDWSSQVTHPAAKRHTWMHKTSRIAQLACCLPAAGTVIYP